jgi:hypothetical protein
MAKITVTVEGSDIGSATISTEYNKTNSDRLVRYLVAMHGTDEDGNPRDLTGMVQAYWDGVVAGTQSNVVRWEQEQAARAAAEAVPPMEAL